MARLISQPDSGRGRCQHLSKRRLDQIADLDHKRPGEGAEFVRCRVGLSRLKSGQAGRSDARGLGERVAAVVTLLAPGANRAYRPAR